jgi:hypothetical protein
MYRILQADKDSYITNKIISNTLRATDSNTGQAGTIDLFKLYDENTFESESNPIEISRALVHFDLDDLRDSLTRGEIDISSPSFSCSLYLHDVYGGQTTPNNFSLVVYPLSKSFDEGIGRDVIRFEDIDVSNFITASISTTVVTWSVSGAGAGGDLLAPGVDYFTQGNLGDGLGSVSFASTQIFSTGKEDLNVDVTRIVSGVLANQIPDSGFRISFIPNQETDQKTRFVKRFASRNTTNTANRPRLIVTYNDVISDKTQNFEFNTSGTIFLNTFAAGSPSNLVSGSSLTQLTGNNCIKVKIRSGSIERTFLGSQYSVGSVPVTGIYSSSFLVNSFDSDIYPKLTGSALNIDSFNFGVKWLSLDEKVQFATGSLPIKRRDTTYFSQTPERYFINITNMQSSYGENEKIRFRMFVEDFNRNIVKVKLPLENTGIIVEKCFYRIRDFESGDIVIPFHDPGTQVSNDSTSHYFDFYMSSLPKGRTYTFDFRIINKGIETNVADVAAKFRIE